MPASHRLLAGVRRELRAALVIASLAVGGCASLIEPSIPLPDELFQASNRAWVGRPFNEVLLRYGQPSGQVPYRNDITVYQFQASNTVRFHESVTSDTNGRVGTYLDNVPYAERTTTRQGYDQSFSCMMRVGVRPDGTVDGVDFVGQMGACQVFMP